MILLVIKNNERKDMKLGRDMDLRKVCGGGESGKWIWSIYIVYMYKNEKYSVLKYYLVFELCVCRGVDRRWYGKLKVVDNYDLVYIKILGFFYFCG